jgi:hypothetical protein
MEEKPKRFIVTAEELDDLLASGIAYGTSPVSAIRRWKDSCKAAVMKRPFPEQDKMMAIVEAAKRQVDKFPEDSQEDLMNAVWALNENSVQE